MKLYIPDHIRSMKPYVPGKPLEELEREYGIKDSIKLASNENPLGPSPKALEAIGEAQRNLHRYPDDTGHVLVGKLADYLGVKSANIVLGNGSDDLLGLLARAFFMPGDEAVIPESSFLMYEITIRCMGGVPVVAPLKGMGIDLSAVREKVSPRCRMVFICSPNNPTGTVITKDEFERFMSALPDNIVVVVDEAYAEFVRDASARNGLDYLTETRPVVTLRTFSKAFGLAGLRVGYGVMPTDMAQLLNRIRQPFNVNSLALAGAAAALDDTRFLAQTVDVVHDGLDYLYKELDHLGIEYSPTQSNFFMIHVRQDAGVIYEKMLRLGVIVRSMAAYGFPEHIRVNVGLPVENRKFLDALRKVL